MDEVVDVVATAWFDPELEFQGARVADLGGGCAILQKHHLQPCRVPAFETQRGDRIAKPRTLDELERLKIDVEPHACGGAVN
jgi:hypothetical protein